MTFLSKMKDLLFHPDAFFTRLENEEINLVPPVLIVLLTGIGLAVTFAIQVYSTGPVAGRSEDEVLMLLLTSYPVISAFIIPVLMWVVASVAICLVARIVSGTGSLVMTFQNIGYGLFPSALYNAVNPLLVFALIPVTMGSSLSGFAMVPMLFLALVSMIVTVWTFCLWVFGAMHAQRIPMGKAILAVAAAFLFQWLVMLLIFAFPVVWGELGPRLFA